MKHCDKFSVSMDGWSDSEQSHFISIAFHYTDSDCVPRSPIVDFVHLPGKYSAESLRTTLDNCIKMHGYI